MTRVRRVRCGVGPADFRWRAVGAWAVVGWVVLPLALTTGSEERLSLRSRSASARPRSRSGRRWP